MFFNIDNNNKKLFLSNMSAYYNDFWKIMWHWRMEGMANAITKINYF